MSRSHDDTDRLSYELDYAQDERAVQAPTFTIFHEKLSLAPSNEVIFDRSDPDRYPITQQLRLENDRCLFSAIRLRSAAGDSNFQPLLEYSTQQISRFNKFRLDPFVLGGPCRIPEVGNEPTAPAPPRIGYHGEDLASTLYYLSVTEDPSLERIRQKIRELVPEFDDFEFNTVGTDRIAFAVRHTDNRESVPSVRLSSGILIYIGLIVLVSTPNRPSVLMIEEPENGLTPQAVKVFYEAVRQLAFNSHQEDRSQVIISSHSPFVICGAWNGEDRDFIHQVSITDGKAVVRKFSTAIQEQGIHLGRVDGERTHLSLKTAEEVMSGRFST